MATPGPHCRIVLVCCPVRKVTTCVALIRRGLRGQDHLPRETRYELGHGGDLFTVVLRCFVPEISVGSYNLLGAAAISETLRERDIFLQPMADKSLPLGCDSAEPLLCFG